MEVPYRPPYWGPKTGSQITPQIRVPNQGTISPPKSGSKIGVPNQGTKWGSQIRVPYIYPTPQITPKWRSHFGVPAHIGVPYRGPKFVIISREVTFCCSVLSNCSVLIQLWLYFQWKKLGSQIGLPNRGTKSGSQIGVPNQGTKLGSQIGVPNWGPKLGSQIGVPNWVINWGPNLGSQIRVLNQGSKSGSQIAVSNEGPKTNHFM
jgi:hypothetical protein